MSKNLDGIVARIRDVRAQKCPVIEKNLQKIDALLAAIRDTRGRASAVAARYPGLKTSLQSVSFTDAENRLLEARAACETALTRLHRDSINISIMGGVHQGKSLLVQTITGIKEWLFPFYEGGNIEARSMVRNGDTESATVFYLTETELLQRTICPCYEPIGTNSVALGLGNPPCSIADFIHQPLPSVPETPSAFALDNWTRVMELHEQFKDNPSLVLKLGSPPESVSLDAIRTCLVAHDKETSLLLVDHIEIVTPFDLDLPHEISVRELSSPWLCSPMSPAEVKKCVFDDTDIVLIVRRPVSTGDAWCLDDICLLDMLKSIYPTDVIEPKDWIQFVLDLDRRPASNNEKIVKLMKENAPHGFSPVVCDCAAKEDVRALLEMAVVPLLEQVGRIDDFRINQFEKAFRTGCAAAERLQTALLHEMS